MLSWKAAKEDDRPAFDDKRQLASNKNFHQIKYLETDVNKCMTATFEYVFAVVNVLVKSGEMYREQHINYTQCY